MSRTDQVVCSPHLFLPDGTDHANPGIKASWNSQYGVGYPVVDSDDPTVIDELLKRSV